MADYSTLKTAIQAVIKQNGNNEITGNILQSSLLAMINSLGAGYQYIGVATPSTNPGTPDEKVFYIASAPGTYANFGGFVVNDGEVCVLKYDTAWHKEVTGAANDLIVSGNYQNWTKGVAYTSGTNIAKADTILNVNIAPGETFYLTFNVTNGITTVKSFIVFANNIDIDQLTDATSNTLLVNTKKKYVASAQINNIRVYMAGSNITANGTLTMIVEKGDKGVLGALKKNNLLLDIPLSCESTEVTRIGELITQIVYKDAGANVVRTDVITYNANTIVEVRTLSSGESLTITTDLSTLNQLFVWN